VDEQELLDLIQAFLHLVSAEHGLSHAHKGADNEYAHFYRPTALEHVRRHHRPVFGESVWQIPSAASVL
jgi:hypothetical protein